MIIFHDQDENMIVFNNRDRPNYEQIVEMGPRWLNEYREMNANYRYAGWTLDLAAYFLDQLVRNEFPMYCDEKSLRNFEKIFAIEYTGEPTLEERRLTVMAYWNGMGKINKPVIQQIIKTVAGVDSAVWWLGLYLQIEMENTDVSDERTRQIKKILRRRMPAHIAYIFRCFYNAGAMYNEEIMRLQKVIFRTGIPFWGCIVYDGRARYDGSFLYDQKRRYGLGLSIQYRMPVHFFGGATYNGVKRYDGTFTYNQWNGVVYGLGMATEYRIPVHEEEQEKIAFRECFYAPVRFKPLYTYNGERIYDGSFQYGQEKISMLRGKVENVMAVQQGGETFGNGTVVTKSKEVYRYDGTMKYDGTFKYNSFYREEQLQ